MKAGTESGGSCTGFNGRSGRGLYQVYGAENQSLDSSSWKGGWEHNIPGCPGRKEVEFSEKHSLDPDNELTGGEMSHLYTLERCVINGQFSFTGRMLIRSIAVDRADAGHAQVTSMCPVKLTTDPVKHCLSKPTSWFSKQSSPLCAV